ncbi:Protein of unknown function [Gryllus bimaculatus]|nr:Protein of unknown function [Gryllus bimaculatus]
MYAKGGASLALDGSARLPLAPGPAPCSPKAKGKMEMRMHRRRCSIAGEESRLLAVALSRSVFSTAAAFSTAAGPRHTLLRRHKQDLRPSLSLSLSHPRPRHRPNPRCERRPPPPPPSLPPQELARLCSTALQDILTAWHGSRVRAATLAALAPRAARGVDALKKSAFPEAALRAPPRSPHAAASAARHRSLAIGPRCRRRRPRRLLLLLRRCALRAVAGPPHPPVRHRPIRPASDPGRDRTRKHITLGNPLTKQKWKHLHSGISNPAPPGLQMEAEEQAKMVVFNYCFILCDVLSVNPIKMERKGSIAEKEKNGTNLEAEFLNVLNESIKLIAFSPLQNIAAHLERLVSPRMRWRKWFRGVQVGVRRFAMILQSEDCLAARSSPPPPSARRLRSLTNGLKPSPRRDTNLICTGHALGTIYRLPVPTLGCRGRSPKS